MIGGNYIDTPCGIRIMAVLTSYYSIREKELNPEQARTWGILTELFLAHCRTGIGIETLRSFQYSIKEDLVPVSIGCKDYDLICELFFKEGNELSLLFPDGTFNKTEIDASLLKEAIDFLRDGQ